MQAPLELLDTLQAIIARPVPDTAILPIAVYLRRRRYSPLAIDQTLAALEAGERLAEMWWLDGQDVAAIEAMLNAE